MKKIILPRLAILILFIITSSTSVWGQTEIHFDITKGDVRLTDAECSGWDKNEKENKTYQHNPNNHYYISGETDIYNVKVGDAGNLVKKNFTIYLNSAVIKIHKKRSGLYNHSNI